MKTRRFDWEGPVATATAIRSWAAALSEPVAVAPIFEEVVERRRL
ncbi:MAG TPA: hypothetical protein VFN82_03300 [Solirubrobacterales bacterium]|nr:hypothetical protein [Solirubrobacterales bacterium]